MKPQPTACTRPSWHIWILNFVSRAGLADCDQALDAAATLGAGPIDRFFYVVIPMSKQGFFVAAVLGFAHTIGEFGVVLMIGGNIPGETQVVSTQIYTYVESLDHDSANALSVLMLLFSFVILLPLYIMQHRGGMGLKLFRVQK